MASVNETRRLVELLEPVLAEIGLGLYDVEVRAGTLLVLVERDGGVDLDQIADAARRCSAALDEHDDVAPRSRYELEVSSPGVERRLRRPEHFRRALGEQVGIRTLPGTPGERRIEGRLLQADDAGVVVTTADAERRLEYDEIERAHTVFDWRAALAGAPSDRSDGPKRTKRAPAGANGEALAEKEGAMRS